jgi:hypothetical protein
MARDDTNPFARWNAEQYLREYYSKVEVEEEHSLRFLVEQSARLPTGATILEFGCGPTLHHVLPFSRRAREIHVADLLSGNLDAVRRWQKRDPRAHDWRPFTKRVLSREGVPNATPRDIEHREETTRRVLTRMICADARRSEPLGALARRYDCVVSCYCADSATADKREWRRLTRNIVSLLSPGGLLLVTALRRCETYTVGTQKFPSAHIDEHDLASVYEQLGLHDIDIEVVGVPCRSEHGFQSILLASAKAAQSFLPRVTEGGTESEPKSRGQGTSGPQTLAPGPVSSQST